MIAKLFFPIALLFFVQTASAQKLKSFDFSFSPEGCYRVLTPRGTAAVSSRNRHEVPGAGFRVGVNYQIFSWDERRAVRTGLLFANSGYRRDDLERTPFARRNTLEIPLNLRFYGGERRCATYFEAGASLHFRTEPEALLPGERLQLGANAGFGFVWLFSKDWGWYGQPSFRYGLTGVRAVGNAREHFLTAGFEMGVRRYFQ